MEKITIGADHRGYALKENIKRLLAGSFGFIDIGTNSVDAVDYPDIASAVAKKILAGESERGVVICGSGVGASVAANKFKGIRAAICHDTFSARQGVEDDAMNVVCLGSGVIGESLAVDVIKAFMNAKFKTEERFIRRLDKVKKIEES